MNSIGLEIEEELDWWIKEKQMPKTDKTKLLLQFVRNSQSQNLMNFLPFSTAWLVLILIAYKNRIWAMDWLTYLDPKWLFLAGNCY